jgi:hypothetical protein
MNLLFDLNTIPKVDNFWACIFALLWLVCGVLAIAGSNKIEAKFIWTLFAASMAFALIGAWVYVATYKDVGDELKKQKEQCEKILKERENFLVESKRDNALKDTCVQDRISLRNELTKANEKNQSLTSKLGTVEYKNELLAKELTKYKSEPYKYFCGYAAIRDKDSGKWGYLKKGDPKSSIEFMYDEACRFSEGRAFVKYNKSNKYGIIDTHLGKPLVSCIFEKPKWFENGRASVVYKGENIYIDKKGDKIDLIKNTLAAK